MSNENVATATTNPDNEGTIKKKSNLSRIRLHSRVIQNYVLVWLDPNMNGVLDDEHRDILNQIRSIINAITIFSDVNQCKIFLDRIKEEKVFLIVSGVFGQYMVPHVQNMPKLDSIYVFCGLKPRHDQWAKNYSKVKGVFTQIAPICELLRQTVQKYEQNFISLSFVTPTDVSDQNIDQLDQSFMYTQILKEILFEITYNEESLQNFISYYREQYHSNTNECQVIKDFEENYQKYSPIYWYSYPSFIHSMLNRALRTHEVNTIIKMGFFIQRLHKEIHDLHLKQTDGQEKQSFIVYRGQGLPKEDFEKLLKAKGGLMSFNNFLSTSKKRDVSLEFAQDALNNLELVGVLFKMVIDPSELATPYALIDNESYFKNEEEILFSMHTVFRIGEIKQIQKNNNRLYQVILTLTNSKNKQITTLTELLREETRGSTGWHRLGMLLIKLGRFHKAEQVYRTLFDLTNDENEKALLYHQLGLVNRNQGNYKEALSSYEQALSIYEKLRPSDDLDLATTYNNIGQVHNNMGKYFEALSYYNKSLEIYKHILPDDHSSLAISYNNIGLVYRNMADYQQALISHEKALEIELKILPSNHPSLAISYKNMGLVYKSMGEYSKALSSHEQALQIEQKILPVNHPSLAISYNNIGLLYDIMGEYTKALSFYERTLEIYQEILPLYHPDFAMIYNNIGSVYKHMDEYSKALLFYEKTLTIEERTLSENHPSLAISYSNIGIVYDNMKEYSQAISSHEKALNICQKSFATEHPILAISYNNMASVYHSQGDYETALTYYKKAVDIELKTLPPSHPDLATSYNNIGLVYDNLGKYSEALSSHEKSLEIYQKSLPSNHPNLANSYNNMGLAYQKLGEHSRALLSYEKALEIRKKTLPPNHPDVIVCYGNITQLYGIMNDYSKARTAYEQLIQAKEKIISENDLTSTTTYSRIEQICNYDGKSLKILSFNPSDVDESLYGENPLRLKNFRKKLEKIAKKINRET